MFKYKGSKFKDFVKKTIQALLILTLNNYYLSNKTLNCAPDIGKIKKNLQSPDSLPVHNHADLSDYDSYFHNNFIFYTNYLRYDKKNSKNMYYNPHFPNSSAEVLIYLTMWQYWWWFWFVFLTVLYYVMLTKVVFTRQKKLNPRINTSVKSHGKWGDLIVGLIPIYWCINILINSNVLLKHLEWQTESNIFTIRVRGRQWYWIYKIDFFYYNFIPKLKRGVGRKKSFFVTKYNNKDSELQRLFFHVVERAAHYKKRKEWLASNKWSLQKSRSQIPLSYPTNKKLIYLLNNKSTKIDLSFVNSSSNKKFRNPQFFNTSNINSNRKRGLWTKSSLSVKNSNIIFKEINRASKLSKWVINSITESLKKTKLLNHNSILFNNNFLKFKAFRESSINFLIEDFVEYRNFENKYFSKSLKKRGKFSIFMKNIDTRTHQLQKKIKLMRTHLINNPARPRTSQTIFQFEKQEERLVFTNSKHSSRVYLKNPYMILKSVRLNNENYMAKINPKYLEVAFGSSRKANLTSTMPQQKIQYADRLLHYSRPERSSRLLRASTVLILPSNFIMATVTNSFDVIHSWFIPGLGIKMDCVPGRSTHHTFIFDVQGLFVGQCAEVCGRFHHHMPIKVGLIYYELFWLYYNHYMSYKFTKYRETK